jgi:hypothetical protein
VLSISEGELRLEMRGAHGGVTWEQSEVTIGVNENPARLTWLVTFQLWNYALMHERCIETNMGGRF